MIEEQEEVIKLKMKKIKRSISLDPLFDLGVDPNYQFKER
jgi:hypothetical protein